MALTMFWRCETTTLTTGDLAQGDTSATLTDAAINTSAVKIGTNGLSLPSEGTAEFTNNNDYVTSGAEGRFGAYVHFNTLASNGWIFVCTDAGGDNAVIIYVNGTDELRARWVGNSGDSDADTTDANLVTTAGTWYFIELAWKQSTNLLKIYVNGTEKASFSGTMNAWTATPTLLLFGDLQMSGADIYMDNIMLSNSSTEDLYALRDSTEAPGAASVWVPFRRMNILLRMCLSVSTLFGRLFK